MDILTKDFVEFTECCVARNVKFLIVGGYALAGTHLFGSISSRRLPGSSSKNVGANG